MVNEMTILEQYNSSSLWDEKIVLMEIYHLGQKMTNKQWTLHDTAWHFNVSIGLVSENLRLAGALRVYPNLNKCESRQQALNMLNKEE